MQYEMRVIAYPKSLYSRFVQENQDERSPETAEHRHESKDKAHNQCRRNEVSKSLHSEEPGESIALHRLEDIVLSHIKHLGIVPSEFLNSCRDVLSDRAWQGDFALSAREKE